MRTASKPAHCDWLRNFGSCQAPEVRLVCFPHAGGTAGYFRRWAGLMPSHVGVIGVQYPGREDRIFEKPIPDLKRLAAEISYSLETQEYDRLALFGHSMGATVAYEVAGALQEEGVLIEHLFVSGQTAPTRTRHTAFHRATDADLIHEVVRLSGTPKEVFEDAELRQILLSAIRNDYAAIETYAAESSMLLSTPITVLLGDGDTEVVGDEALDWSACTRHELNIRSFPGGHFFVSDHVEQVVRLVVGTLGLREHTSVAPARWPSTP